MSDNKDVLTFERGRVARNELELPTLHFIVMDQWVDVIGERALFAWLKMYTWCKRDEETDKNQWDEARIPTSYNNIIKRLGVGRDTFYNRVLKPLWNVGLIDVEVFEDSKAKGVKPMNIIVYKYPQNNKSLAHEELSVIRNYDKDYQSSSKTFAKKGGRPKEESSDNQGGSITEQGVVLNENGGWFSSRTEGGSIIEPNNILNNINNSLNTINNNLNSSSNIFNDREDGKMESDSLQENVVKSSRKVWEEKKNTTTMDIGDSDTKEIMRFWTSNGFGTSTYSQMELLAYLDDEDFDTPKEMIIRAMQLACDYKKQSLSYVKTILHDWINRGIRNLDDLEYAENNRKKKGNEEQVVSYGSIPKEQMSDEEKSYWDKRHEETNANLPDYIT